VPEESPIVGSSRYLEHALRTSAGDESFWSVSLDFMQRQRSPEYPACALRARTKWEFAKVLGRDIVVGSCALENLGLSNANVKRSGRIGRHFIQQQLLSEKDSLAWTKTLIAEQQKPFLIVLP
jgi:hypothetical protein